MAHVAKYKAGAVAGLVRHYGRTADEKNADGDPLERKNPRIKPERTHLNYNLAPTDAEARVAAAMAKHRVKAGRAPRKDAVVMADWVVTRPSDCPKEREKEFFKSVVGFVADRYGKDNLLGAWVHMDETTPHVHVAFVPVRDGKLLASKVLDRNDLRSFHRELSARVKDDLGLEEPLSILVDRGDAARSKMNRLKVDEWMDAQKELEKVKADIEEAKGDLELLTGDTSFHNIETGEQGIGIERAKRELADLAERRQQLISGWDKDGEHHPGMKELESENERLTKANAQLTETNAQLTEDNKQLTGRLAQLNRLVEAATKRFNELTNLIFGRVMDAWRDHGPWAEEKDPVEVNAAIRDEFDEMER